MSPWLLAFTLTTTYVCAAPQTLSAPSGPQGPTGVHLHKDLLKNHFSGGKFGAFNPVHRLQNHNQELQEYHTSSVSQDPNSGEIRIKAEKHSDGRITSGKVETKNVWTTASDLAVKNRGYVEVRATMPAKVNGDNLVGAWPAIWLLGSQPPTWPHCGELDIVELANGVPKVYMTTHSGNHNGGGGQHPSAGGTMSVNSNFVDHELIAGFEWNMHGTQIDLTWWMTYFDLSSNSWKQAKPRTLVIRHGHSQDYTEFYESFQKDGFYLIVNLAEGGMFTGHYHHNEVMVDGQPQYVKVKSAKVYSF